METGQSRGFGFVTYRQPSSAALAIQQGSHIVDGKIVNKKRKLFFLNYLFTITETREIKINLI
jgi:hypothetical protein